LPTRKGKGERGKGGFAQFAVAFLIFFRTAQWKEEKKERKLRAVSDERKGGGKGPEGRN